MLAGIRVEIKKKDGSLYEAFEIDRLNKDGSFPSMVSKSIVNALRWRMTVKISRIK